jgi:hypothetical protein
VKPSDFGILVEARIHEAQARGELDALPGCGKPIPADPLDALPAEQRAEARVLRGAGAEPEEIHLARRITELLAEADRSPPDQRVALVRKAREFELQRNVLLEISGRAVLLNGKLALR